MATRCRPGETEEEARRRHAARQKLWRENNREKYLQGRRAWTEKNREHLSEYERLRSAKRRAESPEYRQNANVRAERWREKVGDEYLRQQNNERNQELKLEMFEAYGRKCACCGDTHFRFMTIHHVNGDGAVHRKTLGNPRQFTGRRFYKWLKDSGFPKDNFEMLCANCHLAKESGDGICPHQIERAQAASG
jgi:hypothetical protein